MREYLTPDFDVTVYEVEDIITLSTISASDPDDDNGNYWFG